MTSTATAMTEGPAYDEQAANWVSAMETALRHLPLESQGLFVAILNAIEVMVEVGEADLAVVRHLGDALLALSQVHHLDARLTRTLSGHLASLYDHITSLPPSV